jgi:hypothetical protein
MGQMDILQLRTELYALLRRESTKSGASRAETSLTSNPMS